MKIKLMASELKKWLDYNHETGALTWRKKPNRHIRIGDIAGTPKEGRVQIGIGGQHYRAHRLAWLHFYGKWPKHQIDHINGNPSDNRIVNLRDVTSSINHQNRRVASKRSITGLLGVSPKRNKFMARIDHKHIGVYDTPELAHAAYISVKRSRHAGNTL